jgi:hypothetical protein
VRDPKRFHPPQGSGDRLVVPAASYYPPLALFALCVLLARRWTLTGLEWLLVA